MIGSEKMKREYDLFIIGNISFDENVYNGYVEKLYGGAVLYAAYAAKATGVKIGVLTKAKEEKGQIVELFGLTPEDVYYIYTPNFTSIRNEYLTEDREERISTILSRSEPFTRKEIPKIKAKVYYLAGLIRGEYEEELIKELAKDGKIAIDMQGFLRVNKDGKLVYEDWDKKNKYLSYVHFLKADALEARVLTGKDNRYEAAKIIHEWGVKEIMITHNSEVIVYDGTYYKVPLKPLNLIGRTGRGDTCFGAYLSKRLNNSISESLLYAAALVSLKMGKSGPFRGTKEDVEHFIEQFYQEEKSYIREEKIFS